MVMKMILIAAETAENALMTKAAVQTQIAHLIRALMGYAWKLIPAKMVF